jgi:hypothetical protein
MHAPASNLARNVPESCRCGRRNTFDAFQHSPEEFLGVNGRGPGLSIFERITPPRDLRGMLVQRG